MRFKIQLFFFSFIATVNRCNTTVIWYNSISGIQHNVHTVYTSVYIQKFWTDFALKLGTWMTNMEVIQKILPSTICNVSNISASS